MLNYEWLVGASTRGACSKKKDQHGTHRKRTQKASVRLCCKVKHTYPKGQQGKAEEKEDQDEEKEKSTTHTQKKKKNGETE